MIIPDLKEIKNMSSHYATVPPRIWLGAKNLIYLDENTMGSVQ